MADPIIFSLTCPVVMAFPTLLEAKAFMKNGKPNGEPKFGAAFIFPASHPDLPELKKALIAAARQKFPSIDLKTLSLCLNTGEKEVEAARKATEAKGKVYDGKADFMLGKLVVKARSKYRPALSFIEGNRVVEITDDAAVKQHIGKFFFGAEVLAQFNLVAYDGDARNPAGVTAYLNMVLATGKGTRIGGMQRSAADTFSGYIGSASAVDPLGSSAASADVDALGF